MKRNFSERSNFRSVTDVNNFSKGSPIYSLRNYDLAFNKQKIINMFQELDYIYWNCDAWVEKSYWFINSIWQIRLLSFLSSAEHWLFWPNRCLISIKKIVFRMVPYELIATTGVPRRYILVPFEFCVILINLLIN